MDLVTRQGTQGDPQGLSPLLQGFSPPLIHPGLLLFCVSKHTLCSHLPSGFCICYSLYLAYSFLTLISMYPGILVDYLFTPLLGPGASPGPPEPISPNHCLGDVCLAESLGLGLNILLVHDSPRVEEWRACMQRGVRGSTASRQPAELSRGFLYPASPASPDGT